MNTMENIVAMVEATTVFLRNLFKLFVVKGRWSKISKKKRNLII